MKLKVFKEWQKKPEFENLLFLAQRLDELFFDYTLDTYKPPALTSVFLCREALALISDIEDDLIDRTNLDHVLDELVWSLSSDLVAKQLLNASIDKFVIRDSNAKLIHVKTRLEVLEHTLNPLLYIVECQNMLKKELKGGSKKAINKIVRIYSSSLVNMGVSKQHIYEQTQKFFFYGDEIISLDSVDEYFYLISPTEHHYEIYFIVSQLIEEVKESIEAFNLSVIDSPPEDVLEVASREGLEPEKGEVWLEVEGIQAFDRHAARQQAETRLDMLRDIFLLFSHKNKIEWRSETIITQCCDEVPVLIRRPKNSMEKCFDLKPAEASQRLNNMISNIGLSGNSFVKFHRAVDLHAAGATNDLPENQLINIWIALETLIPSHVHGGGKIVKISNGIMPILMRNYLTRIIQRLSADLIRWNRRATSKLLRNLPGSKAKSLYFRILELIAIRENAQVLNKLYGELGDFHLLRHRVFELSETFSDPKKLLKLLEEHEKKVVWQLRRIYRSRNLIVHSGRSIPYINTLVENAHDYLDQTINSVLDYSCGFLDANSIEQAFDMAKVDYDVYMDELKSAETFDSQNIQFMLVNA